MTDWRDIEYQRERNRNLVLEVERERLADSARQGERRERPRTSVANWTFAGVLLALHSIGRSMHIIGG